MVRDIIQMSSENCLDASDQFVISSLLKREKEGQGQRRLQQIIQKQIYSSPFNCPLGESLPSTSKPFIDVMDFD